MVSGPGGVGKGTIVEHILGEDDRLWLSRSWTTRDRRSGEPEDAYHFVDRTTFDAHIEADGFHEWVEFLDYRQGTPVVTPPDGMDVLLEIDVFGAEAIRQADRDAVVIFVDAPSRSAQEERLRGRGDPDDRIRRRLEKAEEEVAVAALLEAHVVINDGLAQAVAEIQAIIAAARERW